MKARSLVTVSAAALVAAGALLALLPAPAPAQALSGLDVFRSHCGGCHELYDPEDPKRPRDQWEGILNRMVKVRGATLNKQEFAAVLAYLDSFNRPRREISWVETPAKSRTAALAVADSGRLPAEWVDLTPGAEATIPWAVQVDPVAKTAYLQPLKAAGENQFPVLIDNTGLVQSGSLSTRLQVLSGTGKLGAGVVFGFRNPQSYFGVRVGPRDVVLFEVQGGQRALLARSTQGAPLKQWHALQVEIAAGAVKVSLNGKPLAELSQALAAYRGGRLGLQTQEDTVALFDRWQVTVK